MDKPETKKGRCEYHLCRKKTTLYKCKYCGGYFCKDHIKPTIVVTMKDMWTAKQPDKDIKEKAWREENGHPCWPYSKIFWENVEKQKKKENEEMIEALNKMKYLQTESGIQKIEVYRKSQYEVWLGSTVFWLKRNFLKLFILIIVSLILYSFLTDIGRKQPLGTELGHTINSLFNFFVAHFGNEDRKNCSASLKSGECWKSNQPWYCNNGKLEERADICGCPSYLREYNNTCILRYVCSDGTLAPDCSVNKPYQCVKGQLVENALLCSCPDDYLIDNQTNSCKKIQRCTDGTIYGQCSKTKPFYCLNGTLVEKASLCSCPLNTIADNDRCISIYEKNPVNHTFNWSLRGVKNTVVFTTYEGLKDYLAGLSRSYYCYNNVCPSDQEIQLRYLDEENQKKYLLKLVEVIKNQTSAKDDQARIAISLVQHIPYDWEGFKSGNLRDRYPYEVLYDNKGVCGEKSRLLAFLLRELGFGVVLFQFGSAHMAVGIKCPVQYSYQNTGYCFVESAAPSIITNDQEDYVGIGKLASTPTIISISDGFSFDSVSEEYNDARTFIEINEQTKDYKYVDEYTYNQWLNLMNKYDLWSSLNTG